MPIQLKRAYEPPESSDGYRVLVDRLWPRGLTKEKLPVDAWLKDIAPSNELRKWFNHDPAKWAEFKQRYFQELDGQPGLIKQLAEKARQGPVTLLYGARDRTFNNAVALKEYLERGG